MFRGESGHEEKDGHMADTDLSEGPHRTFFRWDHVESYIENLAPHIAFSSKQRQGRKDRRRCIKTSNE